MLRYNPRLLLPGRPRRGEIPAIGSEEGGSTVRLSKPTFRRYGDSVLVLRPANNLNNRGRHVCHSERREQREPLRRISDSVMRQRDAGTGFCVRAALRYLERIFTGHHASRSAISTLERTTWSKLSSFD